MVLVLDQQRHEEVKNEKAISFKKENLPNFIKKAQFNYSAVQCGNPSWPVHLNSNVSFFKVVKYFAIRVCQQNVCQIQTSLKVGELIFTPIKFVVQIIWDKLFYKTLEKGINTS